MIQLALHNILKQYGSYLAADNVSFEIPSGKIFGLLGPNGAGKTTLIRMITRILYPDAGQILFAGQSLTDLHTQRIGYMPEERGLYKKMKVGEHLIYLARLKGLTKAQAIQRVEFWLNKFEIKEWRNKTIEELSKGMSQKIQFIATVIHEPELLILDEPFSGLDPINSLLIESEIRELSKQGKTIIFSTHRMEQVEEICSDIVLVNKGRKILEGSVSELKQRFKENKFEVKFSGELPPNLLSGFSVVEQQMNRVIVQSGEANHGNDLLKHFLNANVPVHSFQELLPSINEIFIKQVEAA
ncbi:MAG: ATP-binding cassette domain-containing protein [Chitinophagales bacterium]|nr:ATP-binding cassette domain-containing protein [Chitinophagales bacterium]